MDSLLTYLDSPEFRHDVFNPGDSIFDQRFLQVITLHGHRFFGAGPPLVTAFFWACRECHSLQESGDAKMIWPIESAQLYFLAVGPDSGLEFGWPYVQLQNAGNPGDGHFDAVAGPLGKGAHRPEDNRQKCGDFHLERDCTNPRQTTPRHHLSCPSSQHGSLLRAPTPTLPLAGPIRPEPAVRRRDP
jgi:hypothetical protein